jgi:hypothetical protein
MNPNSMLYWFPAVEAAGISHPRTEIVEIGWEPLISILDGKWLPEAVELQLLEATKRIGFPLFLRTDQASGKHHWIHSCHVPALTELRPHVFCVVEENAMADLDCTALVFRGLLTLESTFTAFDGLPIAKERRYFVHDGQVVCHHPYWPEDAIEKGWSMVPLPADWRQQLAVLNIETAEETCELTTLARKVQLPGAWSIDFAFAGDSGWVLLDMAMAQRSWHPGCPYKADLDQPRGCD